MIAEMGARGRPPGTDPGVARLLAMHEADRERDRSTIERMSAALERQARLLERCRRALGADRFEALLRDAQDA